MLRLLCKWRGMGRGGAAFFAALLCTIILNGIFLRAAFVSRIGDFGLPTAMQGLAIDMAYILIPVYFSFLLVSANVALFRVYSCIFFLFCIVPVYFAYTFRSDLHLMIVAFLQTNSNEARGFIGLPLFGFLCAGLLLGVGVATTGKTWQSIRLSKLGSTHWKKHVALPLVSFELVFMINRNVENVSLGYALKNYLPCAFFTQSRETIEKAQVVRERMRTKKNLGMAYKSVDCGMDDLVVVVVIGESARSRNFSLNGYSRDTNPQLRKLPNLVSFGKAFSCQNLTNLAIPGLMTRATTANLNETIGKETSFISVFRGLGYYTAWLTMEPDWSYVDPSYDTVTQIALEAEEHRFSWMVGKTNLKENRLKSTFADEVLLTDLERLLANHRKMLVIINTFGSHYPYQRDYIKGQFAPFQPVCTTVEDCSNFDYLENAYDNTIFYTDHFLSQIISRLKGRRSLFLYVSDHGESIGEDKSGRRVGKTGVFAHGHNSDKFTEMVKDGSYDEQRRVPMIWWASDSFLLDSNSKKRFALLEKKSNDVVSHDNVFHSIIDCAGISSEATDKSMSLCNPSPVPLYDNFLRARN